MKALKKNVETKLELVLVDHHNLPDEDTYLMDSVVKIIDHRPQDERWLWPGREIHLESVGSCATLVARNLFDKHAEIIDSQISSLLRGMQASQQTRWLSLNFIRIYYSDIKLILRYLNVIVIAIFIGPILVDTCNFSKEADRATPVDVEIVESLEKVGLLDLDRDKVFNEIVKAKSDISELTIDDLLIKDLKVIVGIPIVGLPILVKVKTKAYAYSFFYV